MKVGGDHLSVESSIGLMFRRVMTRCQVIDMIRLVLSKEVSQRPVIGDIEVQNRRVLRRSPPRLGSINAKDLEPMPRKERTE